MADHASATKAHRQSLRRRSRNQGNTKRLRTGLKKFLLLIKAGRVEEAKSSIPNLYSLVDKAVDKKVLSQNAAARHKSRFTRQLNAAIVSAGRG